MPKDAPIRWENAELIKILSYINNNFDTWNTNHLSSCLKAIEATNNRRDAKAVYNKIHSLIKAMEEFNTSGKKAATCSIIWEDAKIHDLVRKIYNKTRDRKKKDENQEKKKKDEKRESRERKKKENQEINSRDGDDDDDGDVEMANSTEPVTPTTRSTVNGHAPQIPFSAELIEKLFNEKRQQIDELRTKLTKEAETTNSLFEKVNVQIPIQIDMIDTSCNEKINQITQLKDELLGMIEIANNKYNQLKGFQ